MRGAVGLDPEHPFPCHPGGNPTNGTGGTSKPANFAEQVATGHRGSKAATHAASLVALRVFLVRLRINLNICEPARIASRHGMIALRERPGAAGLLEPAGNG